MLEGLSAFEHAQCTLLARGLPLVKLSLPCSLSPLSLPRLTVPCVLFFLSLRVCFLEVVVRADATETFSSCPHAGRYYCLAHCSYGRVVLHWCRACEYRPCVHEYHPVFLWFRRICLCCSRRASWPAPVIPSAPRDEPTPPSSGDFVPSRDGVLALIRDQLRTLQSQFLPEKPLQPVPYVAAGSQSGELFTPVGWARVFDGCILHFLYCFGPCVLANWAIFSCVDTGVLPLYFGSDLPVLWLRCLCVGLPMFFMFVCWFAHVFHFFIVLTLMGYVLPCLLFGGASL